MFQLILSILAGRTRLNSQFVVSGNFLGDEEKKNFNTKPLMEDTKFTEKKVAFHSS